VIREAPVTEGPRRSKRTVYRIGDSFLRFWFRFIYRRRADIARGLGRDVVDRTSGRDPSARPRSSGSDEVEALPNRADRVRPVLFSREGCRGIPPPDVAILTASDLHREVPTG
jgi:hypothetical protein